MISLKKTLFCILFLMAYAASEGQKLQNTDFSQKCDSSKTGLCHWDLSWGAKGSVRPAKGGGHHVLVIEGKTEKSVGFVEQAALLPHSEELRIIKVNAVIKSDSIEGKGAGLNIGLYDKEGNLLANKDMGGFYSIGWIRGSTAARQYSISIVAPPEAVKMKAGMILYGKGKAAFTGYRVETIPVSDRQPGKLAMQFITAACETIQKNSLHRDSIDLSLLKMTALRIAGPAKTYGDCYPAINYLLESLRPYGDHHSFFMTADEVKNWKTEGSQVSKIELPAYQVVDNYGYILVPPFHGGNQQQILAYADTLQSALRWLHEKNVDGWVIDLRKNTGGNMAPMIAGLGPLFSAKRLGALKDVNGKYDAWYYDKGRYAWDTDTGWMVSEPVELPSRLPIAVLTGDQTGSSGEAVLISFLGNEKTRTFGTPSWGLTTGNGDFDLPDGSKMFLSSTIMADRNNKLYKGSITPDVLVTEKPADGKDPVLKAALTWLRSSR